MTLLALPDELLVAILSLCSAKVWQTVRLVNQRLAELGGSLLFAKVTICQCAFSVKRLQCLAERYGDSIKHLELVPMKLSEKDPLNKHAAEIDMLLNEQACFDPTSLLKIVRSLRLRSLTVACGSWKHPYRSKLGLFRYLTRNCESDYDPGPFLAMAPDLQSLKIDLVQVRAQTLLGGQIFTQLRFLDLRIRLNAPGQLEDARALLQCPLRSLKFNVPIRYIHAWETEAFSSVLASLRGIRDLELGCAMYHEDLLNMLSQNPIKSLSLHDMYVEDIPALISQICRMNLKKLHLRKLLHAAVVNDAIRAKAYTFERITDRVHQEHHLMKFQKAKRVHDQSFCTSFELELPCGINCVTGFKVLPGYSLRSRNSHSIASSVPHCLCSQDDCYMNEKITRSIKLAPATVLPSCASWL